jgi:hypothetical protein
MHMELELKEWLFHLRSSAQAMAWAEESSSKGGMGINFVICIHTRNLQGGICRVRIHVGLVTTISIGTDSL